MLVCHCNLISQAEIEAVITEFLDEDPWRVIVPGMIFKALEKRGKCCGCLPNIADTIIKVVEAHHLALETPPSSVVFLKDRVAGIKANIGRRRNERSRKGHRAVKRRTVSGAGGS